MIFRLQVTDIDWSKLYLRRVRNFQDLENLNLSIEALFISLSKIIK